eukprot:6325055-Amphidinium_carterae.1
MYLPASAMKRREQCCPSKRSPNQRFHELCKRGERAHWTGRSRWCAMLQLTVRRRRWLRPSFRN